VSNNKSAQNQLITLWTQARASKSLRHHCVCARDLPCTFMNWQSTTTIISM